MHTTVVLLLMASFAVFLLSLLSWRLTSSRSVIFNGLLGSVAMLFAAYFAVTRDQRNAFLVYVIPLFVGLALVGRCVGLLIRGKKEPELKLPAYYLLAAGMISLAVCVVAYAGA